MQDLLTEIAEAAAANPDKGAVATYIPELAGIDPDQFGIAIALADGPREVRLRDVSVSGVCFYSDAPIPEMTALGIQLELPNDGGPDERIEAGGAVVRCQRISPHMEHYEVAVFLHDATETTRRKIAKYVDRIGGR